MSLSDNEDYIVEDQYSLEFLDRIKSNYDKYINNNSKDNHKVNVIHVEASSRVLVILWNFLEANGIDKNYKVHLWSKHSIDHDWSFMGTKTIDNLGCSITSPPNIYHHIRVDLLNKGEDVLDTMFAEAKTTFSKSEMENFYVMAIDHIKDTKMVPCTKADLVSNVHFFHDSYKQSQNNTSFMKLCPSFQNINGHPQSSYHDQLKTLTFTVNKNGDEPRRFSHHGNICLAIPIERLLDPFEMNLYLADFYCIDGKEEHIVNLLVCKRNTSADIFCQRHFPELDMQDNKFLKCTINAVNYHLTFSINPRVKIKLIATSEVNFLLTELHDVQELERAWNKKKPKTLNQFCKLCNIFYHDEEEVEMDNTEMIPDCKRIELPFYKDISDDSDKDDEDDLPPCKKMKFYCNVESQ